MPINELETHPFLYDQVDDFKDKNQLAKYCKLIVGTFPIYAITNSVPVGDFGLQIRANWNDYASMQYFYGSVENDFWELISSAFNGEEPDNASEAIDLLNNHGILITDVFGGVFRNGYSPSDIDLINPTVNQEILNLFQNSNKLKIIYFTSIEAKNIFGKILNKRFSKSKDNIENILNKHYRLIVLMTPSSTRSAYHYRHNFPLLQEEIDNRINGNGYALAYRQRYYTHYLTLPCNPIN